MDQEKVGSQQIGGSPEDMAKDGEGQMDEIRDKWRDTRNVDEKDS